MEWNELIDKSKLVLVDFGSVFKAYLLKTNNHVVCKILIYLNQIWEALQHEMQILRITQDT